MFSFSRMSLATIGPCSVCLWNVGKRFQQRVVSREEIAASRQRRDLVRAHQIYSKVSLITLARSQSRRAQLPE